MKKAIVITAWIVGALIGIAILNALGSSDVEPISVTNPDEKLIEKHQYYYDSFVNGCKKGGGSASECQCLLTKIKEKWTFEEFEAIAKEYAKTEKAPEAFVQMTNDCVGV